MSLFIAQYIIYFFAVIFAVASLILLFVPQKFVKKKKLDATAADVIVSYMGTIIVISLAGLIYYIVTQQIIGLILVAYATSVNGIFKLVHYFLTGKVPKQDVITPWIMFVVMSVVIGIVSGYVTF